METIMNKIAFALAATLALGVAAPAFAQSQDSSNRIADYGTRTESVSSDFGGTEAFKAVKLGKAGKSLNTGDYIDETLEEKNQRTSN
jgi:hypothetical protein